MTPERLFTLACEFAQACATAEMWRTRAELAGSTQERQEATGRFHTWNTLATRKREELHAGLNGARSAAPSTHTAGADQDTRRSVS